MPGGGQLHDLSAAIAGLFRQGGQEDEDGSGVLQVAEQLPALAAGDVAPVERFGLVQGRDAPTPPGHAQGRAVAAGQQGQSPLREGQAAAGLRGLSTSFRAFR